MLPVLPVFMLSQAYHILISALYLTHTHENGIHHLISLLERKRICIFLINCSFGWLLTFCLFLVSLTISLSFGLSLCSPHSSYFSAAYFSFTIFLVPISAPRRPHSFHSDSSPAEGLETQAFSVFTPSKALSTSSLSSSPSDPSLHPPAFFDTSQTGITSHQLQWLLIYIEVAEGLESTVHMMLFIDVRDNAALTFNRKDRYELLLLSNNKNLKSPIFCQSLYDHCY